MFLNRADHVLMAWRGAVNHAPVAAYVNSAGDNGHIAINDAINGSMLDGLVSTSVRRITSTALSVIIVLTIVFGYAISSAADIASNGDNGLLTEWNNGLSSATSGIGSLLGSSGSTLNDGFGTAYAALSGDCSSSATGDDAEAKASGCVDGMLDTKLDNGEGDDAVIAKKSNGESCPDVNYVVNALDECVNDNTADNEGTIRDNPSGFFKKLLSYDADYEDSRPELMDILSMLVNRVIVPGYYINSDFQNYAGDGDKVAPYSGGKGYPADIGKDESERTATSKDSSDTVAHMYAWRDMECKTGLTDQYTNATGKPTLNTTNCDIPNIGTEAMQDVASLLTATGMQDSAKTEAKTAFGMGYAGDLLPTDDVPLKASDRTAKYTAMELYGYNLNWTSYAGEFDHIKIMTLVRYNLGLSLGNAIRVAGNALGSFAQGFTDDAAEDWARMTDGDNDWFKRATGFIGFINVFKHLGAGFKAAGYSLVSDVLYATEAQSTVPGAWFRPEFVSGTVYGIRELTSIERASLNLYKAKAALWGEISKHSLTGLDYAKFNSEHAIPAPPKTTKVTECDNDAEKDTEHLGSRRDSGDCEDKDKLESWDDYKKENGLESKLDAIGLAVSTYDGVNGDANAKYKAMAADWPAALKEAADQANEKAKRDSYNSQIDGITDTAVNDDAVRFSESWTNQWYCINDDGSPSGTSQNKFVQMAVQQGIVKDPGLEAYSSDGKWQCDGNEPRPTIIGGLYGSARKEITDEYKDTRRTAYNGISLMDILIGNKLDKWGQRLLGWSQNVIVILNTLVGWCFSPILDKIGFTDLAKKGIEQLRDSIYMQFLLIVIGIGALSIMIKLIRGQPIQGFRQIGLMILAVFLGFIMLFNTDLMFKVVDDLPTAVERAAIATIFSSNGDEDLICDASGAPRGTIGVGSFSDLNGDDTGYNPDAQVRVLQCEIWEAFVLTPWSYGQFGTGVNQLWATGHSSEGMSGSGEFTVDKETQGIVGDGEVDMGGDTTVHNWAIYQLEHTTAGTITTADKASAKTLDKNMYKLVDLQAGPNNGAGRDASHFDTWRGADDNKFMIGLTSLPASIMGVIAIGGLALKKIKYTIIGNLLLLLSPFVFLIGIFPGQGWVKMRTYMFDVLSNMIKRVMMVVFMSIALVILLNIANGPYTSWTVVAIGIYMVCMAIMTYGDDMLNNLLQNVDSKTGDWSQTDDKIKSALMDNRLVNTMGQNIQDVFVGGTGAAIGLVLAGSVRNDNSRRAISKRIDKQLAGVNLLGMGKNGNNNGMISGDDKIIALDLTAITVSSQNGGSKFSSSVGVDVSALATKYAALMSMKGSINERESQIVDIQKQIATLKANPSAKNDNKIKGLQGELNARQKSLDAMKKKYEYMRKDYLRAQNAILKKQQLQNSLKSSSLEAQVNAAQAAGGAPAADVVKNVMKSKMDLKMKEIGTGGDVYNENGVLVEDVSFASEASYRISRIMNRSRLSRLREGKSSLVFELNSNMDKDLNDRMAEAQYSLLHTVNDGGYYGTDEQGNPITTISGAIGLSGIDDDTLKRIINSTSHPMELQALIDDAIQTNDWRQVKSEVGNIFNENIHVQNQFDIWNLGSEDIDSLVNQRLLLEDHIDPATASIREVDAARARVVDALEKSKMMDVIGTDGNVIIERDANGKPVLENGKVKVVQQSIEAMWGGQMASSNVIDRFESTRKAALKELLGPEYENALAEDQSAAGRKKIQQKVKAATSSYDSEMDNLSAQRDAVLSSYDTSAYMTTDERNEMNAALKKIDDAEKAAKQRLDDTTFSASKSRVMERNWREIAMEKKADIENSDNGSDPEHYKKRLNELTTLTAAVEVSENQMMDAIMGKKDLDDLQGHSAQITEMRNTIDNAMNTVTNMNMEINEANSNLIAANAEIMSIQGSVAANPDLSERLRQLQSTVNDLNKEIERCEDTRDKASNLQINMGDKIQQMKTDIINDQAEIILTDGTKIDRRARMNSMLGEQQWELDNVINNKDDLDATRAINNSNEGTADRHTRREMHRKGVTGARIVSDYDNGSSSNQSSPSSGTGLTANGDGGEANIFSWDRISQEEIDETVKKDTQHHYASMGEENSTKSSRGLFGFGRRTDKTVWEHTDNADDYTDHVRLEQEQETVRKQVKNDHPNLSQGELDRLTNDQQQANEDNYNSRFNNQQEIDRQQQFNNDTDNNGEAFGNLLNSGHSQATWASTSIRDPHNDGTNERSVIRDPHETENDGHRDVSSGWLGNAWDGRQDAQGHLKPRGWRGRGHTGRTSRSDPHQ